MSTKPSDVHERARERSRRLKAELRLRGGTLRAFQQAIGRRCGPGTRGASYGGVRAIVEGDIEQPREEIVRAMADELEVRFEYLWNLEGARTEAEHDEDIALDLVMARLPDFEQKEERRLRAEAGLMDNPLLARPHVRALFKMVWQRLIDACPNATSPEEENAIGVSLLRTLRHTMSGWGFVHDLSSRPREYEDYAIAMLHALALAVAEPKRGDPIKELRRADVEEGGES